MQLDLDQPSLATNFQEQESKVPLFDHITRGSPVVSY